MSYKPRSTKRCLVAAAVSTFVLAGAASATTLSVEFTSSSEFDIFFTPVFTALHDGGLSTFTAGEAASTSIELLAEDGNTSGLEMDASAQGASAAVALGTTGASGAFNGAGGQPPLIEPGETASAEIDATAFAGSGAGYFNFASMILPSNDYFFGNANELAYQVFDAAGDFNDGGAGFIEIDVFYSAIYDSGTEVNEDGSDGVLEFAPFVPGSGQLAGNADETVDDVGTIRNLSATPGLNLANLVGTNLPTGGTIFDVPAGGDLVGTFRLSVQPAPVPLPAAAPFLLAGLGAFAVARRRQNKKA